MKRVPAELRIDLLDASLRVATDGDALVRLLRDELGPLVREADGADPSLPLVEVRFDPPPPRLAAGDAPVPLDPASAPEQAYGAIFRALLDRVRGWLLLHAAALERDGHAYLVAGPSGSGKTTLALGLLSRGYRLLSDDFAPLHRETGLVHPFPKPLGIRPGEAARLAAPWLATGRLPAGLLAGDPVPLGGIALVSTGNGPPDPRAPYLYAITVAGDGCAEAERLVRVPGLRLLERRGGEFLCEIHPARVRGADLDRLLEEITANALQHGVVAPPHREGARATLAPLRPSDALVLLLRELQNRRAGNALLRSVGGDAARLALELAEHLAGVPVTGVLAGAPGNTVELLDRWFRGTASG